MHELDWCGFVIIFGEGGSCGVVYVVVACTISVDLRYIFRIM